MHDRLTSRPRILQLVTHDRLGGVRTLVQMVEAGLRDHGFVVDTLPLTSERGGVAAIGDLSRVAAAILSGRYEAILTYQAAASVLGNFLGWIRGVPLRVAHQTAAPEGIRPHWKLIDRLFGTSGIYTHLISNSSATSASFAAWPEPYRNRFVLIPHGVDPIAAPKTKIDWRRQLGIADTALLLVATGRLVEQKNHAIAIEALPLLENAHLVIAGDGPDQQQLLSLADSLGVADRLHLVGPIERADLGALFAASDIYLFPSIWETFGLAGVEAAMAGLPVVASDLAVLREVLDVDATDMVRFHPPHDAAALVRAVGEIAAADPDQAARSAFAAWHVQRHSRARMIERYRDFLLTPIAR